jgi:phosphatidylglycerophosphatase C
MDSSSIIAAFDFDHTLTNRDSLLPFLYQLTGWGEASVRLATLGPAFLSYLAGSISRQSIKEKILERFIGGKLQKRLEASGEEYAAGLLNKYIKPDPLHRLAWHQAQGHSCVLISASLELYLKPWAARYGFDAVLASRLELTQAGHATGRLEGLNCWGPEKVRRLIAFAGPKQGYQLYAYGDSQGDRELLKFADYPFYRKFK